LIYNNREKSQDMGVFFIQTVNRFNRVTTVSWYTMFKPFKMMLEALRRTLMENPVIKIIRHRQ